MLHLYLGTHLPVAPSPHLLLHLSTYLPNLPNLPACLLRVQGGVADVDMEPLPGFPSPGEWWTAEVPVPEGAYEMHCCLSDKGRVGAGCGCGACLSHPMFLST